MLGGLEKPEISYKRKTPSAVVTTLLVANRDFFLPAVPAHSGIRRV
jgi:hypothetical protein